MCSKASIKTPKGLRPFLGCIYCISYKKYMLGDFWGIWGTFGGLLGDFGGLLGALYDFVVLWGTFMVPQNVYHH